MKKATKKGPKKATSVRLFNFGAKTPIENLELIDKQIRLAFGYRNKHVELEWARRGKFYEILGRCFPEFSALEAKIKEVEAGREGAYQALNKARALARKRVEPEDLVAAVTARKEECLRLYKDRQMLLGKIVDKESSLWHSVVLGAKKDAEESKDAEAADFYALWTQDFPSWFEESWQLRQWAKAEAKRIYNEETGLFWGTKLFVQDTVKKNGPPPRKSFWDGGGHLAVQLQPTGGKGKGESRVKGKSLSIAGAFSCTDSRIRIEPLPVPEPPDFIGPRLSKGARKRTVVHFRIGSGPKDEPIFAVIPVTLHARKEFEGPFPPDATIKWVHLIRRKIATQCDWSVQFAIERPSWARSGNGNAQKGWIAIDVGWRITGANGKQRADGSLRVAYWRDYLGNEGELLLPARWLAGMEKVEDLQSIRDETFDIARDALATWLEGLKEIPEWMGPRDPEQKGPTIRTLRQWRSTARLAGLVIKWRENRSAPDAEPMPANNPLAVRLRQQDDKGHLGLKGDEGICALMEAWRRRDKHLYEYEENLRDQLQGWRKDIYRYFASELRKAYAPRRPSPYLSGDPMAETGYRTVKFEDLDLRDFHRLPEIDEPAVDGALKEHVRDACQSLLRRCIEESVYETVKVDPKDTTKKCNNCGSIQEWDHKILRHRCTSCKEEWDQDANAAGNIAVAAGLTNE